MSRWGHFRFTDETVKSTDAKKLMQRNGVASVSIQAKQRSSTAWCSAVFAISLIPGSNAIPAEAASQLCKLYFFPMLGLGDPRQAGAE